MPDGYRSKRRLPNLPIEYMAPGSSSVIKQYVPALAEALGQLRRSPGRNEGWVDGVWRALDEGDPESFEQLRRRLGFARRLAELAELPIEDHAAATAGIFFSELAQLVPSGAGKTTARAWTEYFLRNVDWMAPAFAIVETLETEDWEAAGTDGAVAAKIAVVFDVETASRHRRPLQILQDLFEEAPTEAVARIVPALWSEYGQELCDQHFRRPGSYRVEPSDIRRSLELLKNGQPRTKTAPQPADRTVAPMHFSRQAPTRERPKTARPSIAKRSNASDNNFERRRQALRSGFSEPEHTGDVEHGTEPTWEREEEATMPAQHPPKAELELDGHEDTDDIDLELAASVLRRRPTEGAKAQQEEPMSPTRDISYSRPEPAGSGAVGAQLEDLRAQFAQIQRAAAAGERLLADLAPQLEDLGSWIADIEAVIGRRRRGAGDRVA